MKLTSTDVKFGNCQLQVFDVDFFLNLKFNKLDYDSNQNFEALIKKIKGFPSWVVFHFVFDS